MVTTLIDLNKTIKRITEYTMLRDNKTKREEYIFKYTIPTQAHMASGIQKSRIK